MLTQNSYSLIQVMFVEKITNKLLKLHTYIDTVKIKKNLNNLGTLLSIRFEVNLIEIALIERTHNLLFINNAYTNC